MRGISSIVLTISLCTLAACAQSPIALSGPPAPAIEPGQRWCFFSGHLASSAELDKLTALMLRAKAAGYNGMFVQDPGFAEYQLQPPSFVENFKKFRQACTDNKMKLITGVAQIGYSAHLLTHDPNLAEGMPVRNAAFIVKGGKIVPFDETPGVSNSNFAQWNGDTPVGWTVDAPGKVCFRDDHVDFVGQPSLRIQDPSADGKPVHARFWQKVQVQPWHYYHLSVMVKSQDNTSKDFRMFGYIGGLGEGDTGLCLDWHPLEVPGTSDWTLYRATFCSMDATEVTILAGTWAGKTGKTWWSNLTIEPGGFVNIIRRDSLPLTITSDDGKTVYTEGKDFSQVIDHNLINDPAPGRFSLWHAAPVVTVPGGSRLNEGQKVLASYHFATSAGKPEQMCACMSEPKVYKIIEDQVRWVKENIQPDIYMMGYDEIRIGGWDDSCAQRHMTPGQILGDCVHKVSTIIKTVAPGKPIITWNDMFDPFHNASKTEKNSYLAKGKAPWAGSWDGLTSDIALNNWKQNGAESLSFFADRGNQQILAGYYDKDPQNIVPWLEKASKVKGVAGVMYTTWKHDYSNLEAYIKIVNDWEAQHGKLK